MANHCTCDDFCLIPVHVVVFLSYPFDLPLTFSQAAFISAHRSELSINRPLLGRSHASWCRDLRTIFASVIGRNLDSMTYRNIAAPARVRNPVARRCSIYWTEPAFWDYDGSDEYARTACSDRFAQRSFTGNSGVSHVHYLLCKTGQRDRVVSQSEKSSGDKIK